MSCRCHDHAAACSCNCHIATRGCAGTISFNFPITMFRPDGALQYRLHRSDFIKGMADLYDTFSESARQALIQRDPKAIWPPLEKLPIAVFELTDVSRAQVPWGELKDEADGTDH